MHALKWITRNKGEVLKMANEFQVPVTTKGAGSSLTGGVTPSREVSLDSN